MISPDELAERLTPPPGSGTSYASQLALSDTGMELAERLLDLCPRGSRLQAALDHLERALHAGYAAIDPAYARPPADAAAAGDETPVPYSGPGPAAATPAAALPARPHHHVDPGLWRWAITTADGLGPYARLTACVLAECCSPATGVIEDHAQPALLRLAQGTGLQVGHVQLALRELVAGSWITRSPWHHEGVHRSRYQLLYPPAPSGR